MTIEYHIKNLSKSFRNQQVLISTSLSLYGGQVVGLIGPNGSGKSVFLKCISGLMTCDQGSFIMDGKSIVREEMITLNIGASIEKPKFMNESSVINNLLFLASFRSCVSQKEIFAWLERFDLKTAANKRVKELSLGMKQKLSIIQAMMENQQIILLDEVSNSLDTHTKKVLFEIIEEQKEMGKIIIYVNHNIQEVQRIADVMYEIKDGKICLCEKLDCV